MATKKHCDICDLVFAEDAGKTFDLPNRQRAIDLCGAHVAALGRVIDQWITYQKGGMSDFSDTKFERVTRVRN